MDSTYTQTAQAGSGVLFLLGTPLRMASARSAAMFSAVSEAAQHVLSGGEPGSLAGVISFSKEAKLVCSPTEDPANVRDCFRGIEFGEGAELFEALRCANTVLAGASWQNPGRLIVVTDELPGTHEKVLDELNVLRATGVLPDIFVISDNPAGNGNADAKLGDWTVTLIGEDEIAVALLRALATESIFSEPVVAEPVGAEPPAGNEPSANEATAAESAAAEAAAPETTQSDSEAAPSYSDNSAVFEPQPFESATADDLPAQPVVAEQGYPEWLELFPDRMAALEENLGQLREATMQIGDKLGTQVRMTQQKVNALSSAIRESQVRDMLLSLLLINDVVEQMFASADLTEDQASHKDNYGVILRQIRQIMQVNGVTPVTDLGVFDSKIHKAVEQVIVDDPSLDNIIAKVRRAGFVGEDAVLRPAEVAVNKYQAPIAEIEAPQAEEVETPLAEETGEPTAGAASDGGETNTETVEIVTYENASNEINDPSNAQAGEE